MLTIEPIVSIAEGLQTFKDIYSIRKRLQAGNVIDGPE